MASLINNAFMQIPKRAETNQRSTLLATFVDVGPLFTLLSTLDHQVIYGRRGTGKTHALSYLAERQNAKGDVVVFSDLRNIGSTGGLYADLSIPFARRATTLLVDTLSYIHESLLDFFVHNSEGLDLSVAGPLLDQLADAITEVRVIGTVQSESKATSSLVNEDQSGTTLSFGKGGLGVSANETTKANESQSMEQRRLESGAEEHRIQFGTVSSILKQLATVLAPRKMWILLDEWSSLPIDLQPYLGDFLRRSIFNVTGVTVKIAAIEQRSRFRIMRKHGDYTGIELGADAAADLNLDDYMVFENDAGKATAFFQELLFKHYKSISPEENDPVPRSSTELVRLGFTQSTAFEEFVRSAEGVPRDAIYILSLAAQRALEDRLSIHHVRKAALDWYQRDKESAFKENPAPINLLRWIVDVVIGDRRARAFLLRADESHEVVNTLFDARVLHLLKRNISARDQPGVRYDSYKLDYGCYVDLITTSKSPLGLLPYDDQEGEIAGYTEVPPDDYRSIRRAILDLDQYRKQEHVNVE
jgi:hypothetical protein